MVENSRLAEIARMTDGLYRSMETGDFEKYSIVGGEVQIKALQDGAYFKQVDTVAFENFDPQMYESVPSGAVEDPQEYLRRKLEHVVDGKHIMPEESLGIDYATEVVKIE